MKYFEQFTGALCLAASLLMVASSATYGSTAANQRNLKLSIPSGDPNGCSGPITLPVFNRPIHMIALAGSSNGGDETTVADITIMGYNLLGTNNRMAWSGVDGSGQVVHGASATADAHIMYFGIASPPELDVRLVNASQFKICNFGYGGMPPAAFVMITFLW